MRYTLLLIIGGCLLSSCKKEIDINKVISNLTVSSKTVAADGQSIINVQVELTDKSIIDRRVINFTASSGVFIDSDSNKYTSNAEYDNGKIVAKAMFRAPFESGEIKIEAQPEFDSPVKEFVLTESIIATPSIPTSIKLETSAFGISSNFKNEVQLSALLKNNLGKFVSNGNSVIFEDFLSTGIPANGRFRAIKNKTMGNSSVSGIYSAALYPIGTTIEIRVTLLDNTNQRTSVNDSVFLTINQ